MSACREATGGNPFLVIELLLEARDRAMHPDASRAREVAAIGPSAVSRAVLIRLRRISEVAVEVAKAVALLGSAAGLGYVADVVGVPEQRAAEVIDSLARAGYWNSGRRSTSRIRSCAKRCTQIFPGQSARSDISTPLRCSRGAAPRRSWSPLS